jgi:hypothetical protein
LTPLRLLESWAAWLVLARNLVVVMLAVKLGHVLLEREPAAVVAPAPAHPAPVPEARPVLQS